jgi:hypothetical protein
MDTPATGRGPVGARDRRPVRRDACAPARPTPRQRHHHPAPALRPTEASGPSPVPAAGMARDAGMGYPTISSVGPDVLLERHCRTREVMPPPMITTRQRLLCRPQTIPMSRHRGRLQGPGSACARTATRGGIFEVERAPRRCQARAGRRTGSGPPLAATRAFLANEHPRSPGLAGRDEFNPAAHHGINVTWTVYRGSSRSTS